MKLILHIGTEKTGSTSIQKWGALNRENLKDIGIYYSFVLGSQDHRKASVYARESHLPDDGFIRYNINNEEQHTVFRQELEAALAQEVKDAIELGCHTFLVSSEHFHSRIDNKNMVARTKQLFEPHFNDVEVLAYLRPQAELFQSRLSVVVRNMLITKEDLYDKWHVDENYFNYYKLWENWSSCFSNLNFKPFNKSKDVVLDLANHIGINVSDFKRPERVNEKLDYRIGKLSYNLNRYLTSKLINRSIVDIYSDRLVGDETIQIPLAIARKINNHYMASNLNLCNVCDSFSIEDLISPLNKYPKDGNAEKIFEHDPDMDIVSQVLVINYLEILLLKITNNITSSERALARGNKKNARVFLSKARDLLSRINGIESEGSSFSHVLSRFENIENRILELEKEI